jgi:site-specific DNA recombinase
MVMKAVIYARVSTERQAERGTIGSQVEALRAHVAAAGDELAGEYCDDGHSGARLDRPGLDQMRDAAEAGLFEVAWCLSPDRLARSYAYQVLILDELARFGVSVRFTDAPGLDQDDPQARLLTQVQGVIAEYERAKIGERYRRGKLFRARAGEVISWKAPYGYRRIPRGADCPAHLEIFEPEAAVVRRIFAERAAGTTIRQICRQLNADAVPTPTGSRAVWGTSTLDRILRNEAYIGRTYFNRTEAVPARRPGHHSRQVPRPRADWIAIGCPAIIADETFEAAGKVSTDNTKWSPRRAEPGAWLLRGLVKCGPCGVGTSCHKMRGRNGTWHRYYYCHNHDPLRAGGQDRRCPERNIRADALDEFVFGQVRAALLDPGLLLAGEQAIAVHAPVPDDQLLAAELARLDRKLEAARGEHRRLVDLYQAGLINMPELQRRAAAITARQRELDHKRASLAAERADLARGNRLRHGVQNFATRVCAVIDQLDPAQRQQLLRLLIEDIQVTGWHVKIRLRIPLDDPPDRDHTRRRAPQPGPTPASSGTPPLSTEDRLRSLHDDDAGVVEQPVEEADGGGVLGQEPAPLVEGPVAGDAQGAAFVGGRDDAEQQLGAGVIERGEADFVDEDEVVAEQGVDDPADGVVGQAAVEGLGEVGGGVVADLVPGLDRGGSQCHEQVGFAGAGRADQAQVLGGADPFQRGQVGEGGRRDGGGAQVELFQRLGHRERGVAQPGPGVGGVAGGDLGLDQGAEQFFRGPPLGLRGQQELGGEPPHRGHFQPAQPLGQVGGQRRDGRGHDRPPMA